MQIKDEIRIFTFIDKDVRAEKLYKKYSHLKISDTDIQEKKLGLFIFKEDNVRNLES